MYSRRTFSIKLRYYRLINGYTQIEMANLLDVSESHIKNIESGNATPGICLLEKFSNLSGLSMDYLLNDMENGNGYELIPNDICDYMKIIAFACYRLGKREKKLLLDVIYSMLQEVDK